MTNTFKKLVETATNEKNNSQDRADAINKIIKKGIGSDNMANLSSLNQFNPHQEKLINLVKNEYRKIYGWRKKQALTDGKINFLKSIFELTILFSQFKVKDDSWSPIGNDKHLLKFLYILIQFQFPPMRTLEIVSTFITHHNKIYQNSTGLFKKIPKLKKILIDSLHQHIMHSSIQILTNNGKNIKFRGKNSCVLPLLKLLKQIQAELNSNQFHQIVVSLIPTKQNSAKPTSQRTPIPDVFANNKQTLTKPTAQKCAEAREVPIATRIAYDLIESIKMAERRKKRASAKQPTSENTEHTSPTKATSDKFSKKRKISETGPKQETLPPNKKKRYRL